MEPDGWIDVFYRLMRQVDSSRLESSWVRQLGEAEAEPPVAETALANYPMWKTNFATKYSITEPSSLRKKITNYIFLQHKLIKKNK